MQRGDKRPIFIFYENSCLREGRKGGGGGAEIGFVCPFLLVFHVFAPTLIPSPLPRSPSPKQEIAEATDTAEAEATRELRIRARERPRAVIKAGRREDILRLGDRRADPHRLCYHHQRRLQRALDDSDPLSDIDEPLRPHTLRFPSILRLRLAVGLRLDR